ncbi:uncharacterized protein LOC131216790 [Anopheles bellator]|uniref:uncharacterized protein LOC131216790 n=1 Tax=Anopheles bellator TaxID=139047 RepID=UPI002647EB73|nr:uncharacterized protein LOC131216790 [Anopheles bellator]
MRLIELVVASLAAVALVLVVNCSALHMYPEIFDTKSQFLQARALPAKGGDSAPSALADGPQFRSGSKDDEVGYVRSSSESGKGGYLHRENFHRKDGNKYGNEKQTGFGESKRAKDSNGTPQVGELKDAIIIDTDHHRPEPTYEVTEEQSDVENPDKDKKYGVARPIAGGGDKRKTPQGKKAKPAARPKAGRSNQQNNHNGYESIVYHEKEHDSMEKGYGKRKASGRMPAKQIAYDYLGEVDDEQRLLDDGEGGRDDSDFGDNYEMVRFDADFERSYGDEGEDEQEGDEKAAAGRSDGPDQRQDGRHEDYDYDEEVDREQVDESASEDKYRGDDESGEESDDDGDERQYEYASEADGDAQDY